MSSLLKALPSFGVLTEAEAAVFEDLAEIRTFAAASEVVVSDSLIVVREGALGLGVHSGNSVRPLGSLEAGGLLGEMRLFEADPVPLQAKALSDTPSLTWTLFDLKNAFRYSRTGAAKVMAVFARSLSQKIRQANALLEKASKGPETTDRHPRELDAQVLQKLRSFSVSRDYAPGTVIFEENDPAGALFVIADGEVEIVKKTEGGEPMTLARLGPGDFFGEMAFVDESPRSASAIARAPVRAHVLPSGSLERILDFNLGTALYFTSVLCQIMSRRLDATLRRIASL